MRLKTYLLLGLVLILAMVTGCSSGSSSSGGGGTNSTANVSGTWKGTGNSKETGTVPTTLILTQSGNNVSGTWDNRAVTGTVAGDQLTLTLVPFTEDGINFTGGGNATVSGNNMNGNIRMTGKKGSQTVTISGTFNATRTNTKEQNLMTYSNGFVSTIAKAIAQ